MKKIISMAIFSLCVITISEQIKNMTYHSFWFKGKKIKNNILLTAKAETVNYNPAKGVIIVTNKTGRGKQFDNMLKELNIISQYIQKMTVRLMKNLLKEAKPAILNDVDSSYNEVKEKYITLPGNTIHTSFSSIHALFKLPVAFADDLLNANQ